MKFRTTLTPLLGALVALAACEPKPQPDEHREFVIRVDNLSPTVSMYASGRFETPFGRIKPRPLRAGEHYELELELGPGTRLQIITMLTDSNDAFIAFEPGGIRVWTEGDTPTPITGDRSAALVLWDAGSELNEPLGLGVNQARRQVAPRVGKIEHGVVTRIVGAGEEAGLGPQGFEFPAPDRVLSVELERLEGWNFRLTLTNISPPDLIPSELGLPRAAELSPGVYTVHEPSVTSFDVGEPVSRELESLVEDADPEAMEAALFERRGVRAELSNVVWVVHHDGLKIYDLGAAAEPGLERLAEDGNTAVLFDDIAELAAAGDSDITAYGVAGRGPTLDPEQGLTFRIDAEPGDRLSLAIAYLAANDKFISLGELGTPLFDGGGEARTGDLSWALELNDAGTEIDEPLGLGLSQYGRQPSPDVGAEEFGTVTRLFGPWMGVSYPTADELARLRVEVVGDEDETGDDDHERRD